MQADTYHVRQNNARMYCDNVNTCFDRDPFLKIPLKEELQNESNRTENACCYVDREGVSERV